MKSIREYISSNKLKLNYINNNLNVVNYDEILLLTESKIMILKDKKTITIKGDNLIVSKLLEQEILIEGVIKSIEM